MTLLIKGSANGNTSSQIANYIKRRTQTFRYCSKWHTLGENTLDVSSALSGPEPPSLGI
jgi:hypothetical protein